MSQSPTDISPYDDANYQVMVALPSTVQHVEYISGPMRKNSRSNLTLDIPCSTVGSDDRYEPIAIITNPDNEITSSILNQAQTDYNTLGAEASRSPKVTFSEFVTVCQYETKSPPNVCGATTEHSQSCQTELVCSVIEAGSLSPSSSFPTKITLDSLTRSSSRSRPKAPNVMNFKGRHRLLAFSRHDNYIAIRLKSRLKRTKKFMYKVASLGSGGSGGSFANLLAATAFLDSIKSDSAPEYEARNSNSESSSENLNNNNDQCLSSSSLDPRTNSIPQIPKGGCIIKKVLNKFYKKLVMI
ncbi:hypothetical protein V1511DRAFT_508271 [Dipodascopsis uninucleata]